VLVGPNWCRVDLLYDQWRSELPIKRNYEHLKMISLFERSNILFRSIVL